MKLNYWEMKNNYSELLNKYYSIGNLHNESNYSITCIEKTFIKSGSKWKEITKKSSEVDNSFYCNIFDPAAVRFFRNLGGYEKVVCGYTFAGYLPIESISISPDRQTKTVKEFHIAHMETKTSEILGYIVEAEAKAEAERKQA